MVKIKPLSNPTVENSSEKGVWRDEGFRSSEIRRERCKGAQYAKCESEKIVAIVQRWRSSHSSIQRRRLVQKIEFGELMLFGIQSSGVKDAKE